MYFEELGFPLALAVAVASALLLAALGMALWRVARGPSPFDRILALELVSGTCLGAIVLFAIHFGQPIMLEAAFILALIGFLGTVAFARYLEKGDGQ